MPRHLSRRRETHDLAPLVPSLRAETIHQLIHVRGLDACADLVAAATPAQIARVLDLELWRAPRPGDDDLFDADRFGEWIETLVDHDPSSAARVVAAMETRVAAVGLSQFMRVFDPGVFMPSAQSDDEARDLRGAMTGGVETREIGGYVAAFHRTDAIDAIAALLGAMEDAHPVAFHALMRACRDVSNSRPEIDGLDDRLMRPAQLAYDAAADRRERRARQGYAAAAEARAFLEQARHARRHDGSTAGAAHPIAAAYFRASREDPDDSAIPTEGKDVAAAYDAIAEWLGDDAAAEVVQGPRALLTGAAGAEPRLREITAVLAELHDADPGGYLARMEELGFLANTLAAGCSLESRAFTPHEASEAAAAICNLGLERGGRTADLIAAFEIGWAVLYQDVSMAAADALIGAIETLRVADAELLVDLHRVRRALIDARAAGAPWGPRESLDPIAALDLVTWTAVLGPLSECPVLPQALTAIVDRRTEPIDTSAFTFIGTSADVERVKAFLARLPSLLAG